MSHTNHHKPFLAVVSSAMPPDALATLRHIAASVITLPPDPSLPAPVASHPDMLLFSIGDALVTHRSYYTAAQTEIDRILACSGLRLVLTDCPRGAAYPLDVGLNALLCGKYLFGRTDVLAPEILTLASENGFLPVHIRQGYAGCSGLVIGDAIATADPSLTQAAAKHGIPVIPAPYEEILLPGYDHGFFGGCGGVWRNMVFLCGTMTISRYPDFFNHPLLHGKAIYFLSAAPLFDCGGIKIFPV